jgi:hypothetical protein
VPAGAPCALTGGGWPNGPRGAAWGLKAAMVEAVRWSSKREFATWQSVWGGNVQDENAGV